MKTYQDAQYYVHESLGDYVEDFDVDGIISALREINNNSFDFRNIDPDTFTAVIQDYDVKEES